MTERNSTDGTPIVPVIDAFLRDKGKGKAGESGNYRSAAARELDRFVSWLRDEELGQEPTFSALDERTFRRYAALSRWTRDGERHHMHLLCLRLLVLWVGRR